MYSKTQNASRGGSPLGLRRGLELVAVHAFAVQDHRLSRFDVAHEARAEVVEGAGLGGKAVAAVQLRQRERPQPIGVAYSNHAVLGQHCQAVGAVGATHHVAHALAPVAPWRRRDEVGDDLRVGRGLELAAVRFELRAQQVGVDDVAVVAQRDDAVRAFDDEGLRVLDAGWSRWWSSACGPPLRIPGDAKGLPLGRPVKLDPCPCGL